MRRPKMSVDFAAMLLATAFGPAADGLCMAELEGQRDAGETLSPAEMKEDVDRLASALLNAHPATAAGLSQRTLCCVKEARERCESSMSVGDFYYVVAKVLCSMEDAHTCAHPCVREASLSGLCVRWFQDGLFAVKDSAGLRKGDRIVSIGGKAPEAILGELGDFVSHENDEWLKQNIGAHLFTEAGVRALKLLGPDGKMDVEFQRGEETGHVRLEMSGYFWTRLLGSIMSPLSWPFRSSDGWVGYSVDKSRSVAVFKLDSCIYDDLYKRKVKEFFSEVAKEGVKDVVVDLRWNSGGNSMVAGEFIRYLDVKRYKEFGYDIRYSETVAKELEKLNLPGAGLKQLIEEMRNKDGRVESHAGALKTNQRVDKGLRFSGRVWALVSMMSFSSAVDFACLLQDNGIGMVAGELPGGVASSYGDCIIFQLPASKIVCQISYKRFVRPDPSRGDALTPDVVAPTASSDFLSGRDPQMERVYELAKTPEDGSFKSIAAFKKANPPVRAEGFYATSLRMAPPLRVADLKNVVVGKDWGGPSDCSATCRVARDAQGITVGVQVADDVFASGGGKAWEGDAVELFFDFRSGAAFGSEDYGRGVVHVIVAPNPGNPGSPAVSFHPDAEKSGIDGFVAKSSARQDGYSLEVFIPFEGLKRNHCVPGDIFGFSIAIDDSDSKGRKTQLVWGGDDLNYLDASQFGIMRPLGGDAASH